MQFEGVADFSGRNLIGRLHFTRARFNQPPIFDRCKGTQRLDFYGARIGFAGKWPRSWIPWWIRRWLTPAISTRGWTALSDTALRLRALRTLAEDTKNHDLERDLYIEERKAERGILFAQYWREGWKGRLALHGIEWVIISQFRSTDCCCARSCCEFVDDAVACSSQPPSLRRKFGKP